MLKIIKLLSLFILVYAIWFTLFPKTISAQCACDCICVLNGTEVGSCDCDNPSCSRGSPSLTNWGPNCGGATPPPGGGGGGGGGYQYPTCSGNTVLKCGSPTIYNTGSTTPQCTFRITCGGLFPSVFTTNGCDGNDTKGYCQNNCSCCAPTDNYVKTTTQGSTYERINSCFYPPTVCNDWDDEYVSHRALTASEQTVANRCYRACNNCGDDDEEWFWVYNVMTTCRTVTTTWSCQPSCVTTSPSVPTLLQPLNGSVILSDNVDLTWNTATQTWGVGCPTNSDEFFVYIGTIPSNLTLRNVVSKTVGGMNFVGSSGTYYWRVDANNGSRITPSTVRSFTINSNVSAWWQVKDGDITTNGSLNSEVPNNQFFNTNGDGGFPGVPVYGSTFNVFLTTPERVSETIWNANTTTSLSRIFNYNFFNNLIPETIEFNDINNLPSGGSVTDNNGYEWYKVNGTLDTIGDINLQSRKVVLFVENGNLNVGGKINLTDGVGFFGAFVQGSITIDPAVTGSPSIEGIYLSNNNFNSSESDTQFHLRGSLAVFGTSSLQRDLADNSVPAELFEYAPDQVMLFPSQLRFGRSKWTEVTP